MYAVSITLIKLSLSRTLLKGVELVFSKLIYISLDIKLGCILLGIKSADYRIKTSFFSD